ncbi:unnamed protein product [Caenorhabditis brenneri]
MFPRNFILLGFFFTCALADFDCSEQDTCFGEPTDCDPNADCNTLFHFDVDGNLHLVLRNFSDPYGYAAFAINQLPEEVTEYLICLPYHRQRHRAVAELGGLVSIVEENITGSIEFLGKRDFQCMFNVSDFPESFREGQEFFVTRGKYRDVFVIYDGVPLYSLDDYVDYSLDEEKLRLRRGLQQKKKEKTEHQREETVQQDYTGPHHDLDKSDSNDSDSLEQNNLPIHIQELKNLNIIKEKPGEFITIILNNDPQHEVSRDRLQGNEDEILEYIDSWRSVFSDGLRHDFRSPNLVGAGDKKRVDVYPIEKPENQPVTFVRNEIENARKDSNHNAAQRNRILSDGPRHDVENFDNYPFFGGRLQNYINILHKQQGLLHDGLRHDMQLLVTDAITGNGQNGEWNGSKLNNGNEHPSFKRARHFHGLHHDVPINSGSLARAMMLFMIVLPFLL